MRASSLCSAFQRPVSRTAAAIAISAILGCTRTAPPPKPADARQTLPTKVGTPAKSAAEIARLSDAELDSTVGPEIQTFCSRCHALPQANEAPRENWRQEVEQAFGFHKQSPAKDGPAPDFEAVIAYFERKATPYREITPPPLGDSDAGRVKFSKLEVRFAGSSQSPALAGLTWIKPDNDLPGALLACDMRSSGVYSISPTGDYETIVSPDSKVLSNPCHLEPCDLDGDGQLDLVAADLGNFYPADHQFGRIVWLRRIADQGRYEPIEIGGALARVADVRPGDFDGDGDQDLVVAEFGLHTTGRVLLLENQRNETGKTKFAIREVDPRPGAIHVPVSDLDGDGKLDFVALFGQEHEVVEAFLNQGDCKFEKRRIYTAPNPSWASSGIQLVDMDADGDLDVLNSNGDSFDRAYLKPYHALRWLENRGEFPWVEHHLADMPGCQCALAGDLDGDGDLDIVAVALLPGAVLDRFGSERFDAVCWFEQTSPGEFHRHTLELGTCNHAALTLADFDDDGDLDLAVGNFYFRDAQPEEPLPGLTIWKNLGEADPDAPAGGR